VTTFAFQDFRGYLIWSSAYCTFFLPVKFEFCRKSKIRKLQLHFVGQKQIAQLQIPVYHLIFVQLPQPAQHLQYITLHLDLGESLPPSDLLVDGLVDAQLQQDVHLLTVLKEMVESHYVRVFQGAVDADFAHQLLLGPSFDQGRFGDYFGGQDLLSFDAGELVDSCEPSFSQELSFALFYRYYCTI
jgi:hypothetical protein